MPARCLETRRTPEGFRRRRYEQDGVRFTTIEVPIEVWCSFQAARPQPGRPGADRAAGLKTQAAEMLGQGKTQIAVAAELGLHKKTIHRWKRTLKDSK